MAHPDIEALLASNRAAIARRKKNLLKALSEDEPPRKPFLVHYSPASDQLRIDIGERRVGEALFFQESTEEVVVRVVPDGTQLLSVTVPGVSRLDARWLWWRDNVMQLPRRQRAVFFSEHNHAELWRILMEKMRSHYSASTTE